MRVLLVHNRYRRPGGEDAVFAVEGALLRRMGVEVGEYVEDNARVSARGNAGVGLRAIWSVESRRRLRRVLDRERPAVAHFHNTFPLISPSAYAACRDKGIPVVQTLHNYRLVCPAATLYRDGDVCEECLGRMSPWPAIAHACYRHSRLSSAGVTAMLTLHNARGTWHTAVDLYVALCEFARRKFIQGGLPADRIVVKPNFVHPDPGRGGDGGYVLFAGRLSPEKGVMPLLESWQHLPGIPLLLVGDGPLLAEVQRHAASRSHGNITVRGRASREQVMDLMKSARFLVFPSRTYENFPMVIGEAFACGLPVVAPDSGAAGEIVENRRTGLHVRGGDPRDLAEKVAWLWSHPGESRRMGMEARAEFEARYTAEKNYPLLRDIYARAGAR